MTRTSNMILISCPCHVVVYSWAVVVGVKYESVAVDVVVKKNNDKCDCHCLGGWATGNGRQ